MRTASTSARPFCIYKPTPRSETRYQVRVGLFYPPISLENGGPFWTTTSTITPSAINSWVGEEVKVVGAEASVRRAFGDQELGLTGGVFGFDDNAGELIALRGWSLDNVRESVGGGFRLPPVSDFLEYVQSQHEAPLTEFDGRVGGYARLDWRVSDRLALNAFAYDNDAKPTAVYDGQWGWRTRFVEVGARFDPDERTEVLGQALFGQTQMGPGDPDRWVNTDFSAAYLLVSRRLGDADALTGRLDLFETRDSTDAYYGLTQEHGWAVTADYLRPLSKHATLLVEALHIWSDRPAREDNAADAPTQAQTVVQTALETVVLRFHPNRAGLNSDAGSSRSRFRAHALDSASQAIRRSRARESWSRIACAAAASSKSAACSAARASSALGWS